MSKMLSKMNLISVVQQLPEEDIETIQGYIKMIEEENEKLKQAVRNTYETSQEMLAELTKQNEFLMKRENKLQVLEMKNKEFIKWLENMLDDENDIFSVVRVKDVLQKHKEIIGVSDDKTN